MRFVLFGEAAEAAFAEAALYGRLMASAIARTCSGVEPQQPPTTRAPAST